MRTFNLVRQTGTISHLIGAMGAAAEISCRLCEILCAIFDFISMRYLMLCKLSITY